MSEAKKHIEPHKAVFILVGCKRDIAEAASQNREVSEDDARAFALQNKMNFVETSSKTGLNVEDAFAILTQAIYDKIETGEYKIEDGWDGIKRGYFGVTGGSSPVNNNRRQNNVSGAGMLEAQPAQKCC